MEQKVHKIAEELINLEMNFIKDLQITDMVYLSVLPQLIDEKDIIKLGLSTFLKIHQTQDKIFLGMLGRIRPVPGQKLALPHTQTFAVFESLVNQYTEYIGIYTPFIEALEEVLQTDAFKLKYEECINQPLAEEKPLSYFLSTPFNQVDNYRAKLSELIGITNLNMDKIVQIRDIVKRLTELSKSIKKIRSEQDRRTQLIEIFRKFGQDTRLAGKSDRVMIKEQNLLRYGRHGFTPIRIVLFSDSILIGKPVDKSYQMRRMLDLKFVKVSEIPDKFLKNCFQISTYSKSYIIQATSTNNKKNWVDLITKSVEPVLIEQAKKGHINLRIIERCSSSDCPNDLPLSEEDRFICRCCSKVYCYNCSARFDVMENRDDDEELLIPFCKNCFDVNDKSGVKENIKVSRELPVGWKTDEKNSSIYSFEPCRIVTRVNPNVYFFMEQINCNEILPPNWKRNYTLNGDKFYENEINDEVTWGKPEE